MQLRAHHLVVSLFTGAVVLGSLAVLTVNPRTAQAACATGSSVLITSPANTVTGTTQTGVINLSAYSTPIAASSLSFVLLPSTATTTQQPIGMATLNGSQWVLSWDSRNQPNGTYQLMAVAHFGTSTTQDCASSLVPLSVYNLATQAPLLEGAITPNTWQGPLGSSAPFSLDALYTDQYGRKSHVSPASVNWHSPFGATLPVSANPTVFTAGAVGSGPLTVAFSYNSLAATAIAQVKVSAPTTTATASPTPTPTPKPSSSPSTVNTASTEPTPTPSPVSAADATRLAAMPTIFRPTAPTNSDPVVNIPTLSCLEIALGKVRFSEISGGKSQPTAAERKLAAACFSGAEPIPSVLAPIAPANLTELDSTTDIVSLTSIDNHTTTAKNGKTVKGLLLSGKGSPNSNIFIYVFSDPLVLRAETDSQGSWKYVLETPLKAGHHEVYAVAEKDAGNFVRTSAVPITIAAAAQGSQDGNLVVEGKWSTAQIGFAAGAGVLVLAAFGVLFTIMRRRRPAALVAADTVHSVSSAASAPGPLPGLIQPNAPAAAPAAEVVPAPPVPTPPATPAAPATIDPAAGPSQPTEPTSHDAQV